MKRSSKNYKQKVRRLLTIINFTYSALKRNIVLTKLGKLTIYIIYLGFVFIHILTQAQNIGDTIYGIGALHTKDIEYSNKIPNVQLSLRPESMLGILPDSIYYYISNAQGIAYYNLPIYIDPSTGQGEFARVVPKAFPSIGSELNIIFPQAEKGIIEIYNNYGQLQMKKSFNTDHEYLLLNNLHSGMYIYSVRTNNGIVYNGKFIKQNIAASGPVKRPLNDNFITNKNNLLYEASYWAKWEKDGYYTDSLLITFDEGFDNIDLNIKSNIDIIWGEVFINFEDTIGGQSLSNIDVFIRPDSIEMVAWDTIYHYLTNDNGDIEFFNLPVYIDTIPDDTIIGSDFMARYWIKWVPEQGPFSGFYTDSSLIEISEEFSWAILYLETVPGLPQHQHIGGDVHDELDQALEGVTVWIKDLATDEVLGETITDSNGNYMFANPVPVGTQIYFGVGGLPEKYAFVGDEYSVPEEIVQWDDTIKSNFKYILYDKLRSPPDNPDTAEMVHAWKFRAVIGQNDLNMNISLHDTLRFHIDQSGELWWKEQVNETMGTFATMMGIPTVIQVDYPLNENLLNYNLYTNYDSVGINIIKGLAWGGSDGLNFTTPLGVTRYSMVGGFARTPGGENTTLHEMGHSLSLSHPSGWSDTFMKDSQCPLPLVHDKILIDLGFIHTKKIYTGKAYFDLRNIQEDFSQYQPCPGPTFIYDEDGNAYTTAQVGEQCWLRNNLLVGTFIPSTQEPSDDGTIEKYCFYDDSGNCYIYGAYYTWEEIMKYESIEGSQGICPDGWHIPSDDDWRILEGFTDYEYNYEDTEWYNTGWRGNNAGEIIKRDHAFNGWDIYGVKMDGWGTRIVGGFEGCGSLGYYWTSSFNSTGEPAFRHFSYWEDKSFRDFQEDETIGYSVRCLKDSD